MCCDSKKNVKNFCEVNRNKNMEERERIVRGIKKFKNFLTPYWIITIFLGTLVNSGEFFFYFLNTFYCFGGIFKLTPLIKKTKKTSPKFNLLYSAKSPVKHIIRSGNWYCVLILYFKGISLTFSILLFFIIKMSMEEEGYYSIAAV